MNCFANKVLEFSNGSETAKTELGFSTLPDWCEKHPYFQAAVGDGSIKTYGTSTFSEAEKIAALEAENANLKAEIEAAKASEIERLKAEGEALKFAKTSQVSDPQLVTQIDENQTPAEQTQPDAPTFEDVPAVQPVTVSAKAKK